MEPQQPQLGLLQKLVIYKRMYGWRALIVRCTERLVGYESRTSGFASDVRRALPLERVGPATHQTRLAESIVKAEFASIQPLPVYTAPGPKRRVNLVTDSINAGSLFGGVGTAMIFAALKARKLDACLRIITRTQVPKEQGLAQVLDCNGIRFDDNVEFVQMRVGDDVAQLDVCGGDEFLTTSWWSTSAVLGSVHPSKVEYLLQEDERMFYPFGDEWLRCQEVLEREDIRFYVNTKLLFDHLVASGLTHLNRCAQYFEPAFPESLFHERKEGAATRKRRLFFYARPNNLRNLFFRGLEALDHAIAKKVIDPEQWEIVLVGKDVPQVVFAGGVQPTVLPTMEWREYAAFIRGVDLGFCLMSTPHPSYPPFDLASSGVVVVTNTFGNKQDLSGYSRNIVMSDLDVASLTNALAKGAELAKDSRRRRDNYAKNQIQRSWESSFHDILNSIG